MEKAYITYHNGNRIIKDTVSIKEGKYSFKGKVNEPVVATVSLKKKNWLLPLPSDQLSILLMPGQAVEVVSKDVMPVTHFIKSSAAQAQLDTLVKWEHTYSSMMDSVSTVAAMAGRNKDSILHLRLLNYFDALHDEQPLAVYGKFVEVYPQSPVALYALEKMVNGSMNPDEAQRLWHSLPAAAQKLPTAIRLKKEIAAARRTAVGAYAMNFTQTDTAGKTVSLRSFKGRWVLIDFWASWCGPCRRENPNLVRVYEKFKDRNFTVLGVSVDESHKRLAWVKAIKEDGLVWPQVMDIQHPYNYAAQLYRIAFIPQNVLVNPQGRIAAKNLKGAALHAWLEKLLPPADGTQPL